MHKDCGRSCTVSPVLRHPGADFSFIHSGGIAAFLLQRVQQVSQCRRRSGRMYCKSALSADRGDRDVCGPDRAFGYLCDTDH